MQRGNKDKYNTNHKQFLNLNKMEDLVKKIKENIDLFVANADAQVSKNNKAAGARARKAALELMKDLKEFRKVSVEEAKN